MKQLILLKTSSGSGGSGDLRRRWLRRSVVRYNYRDGHGGGGVDNGGTVADCTIADNWVADGARTPGMAVAGQVLVESCVISNSTNAVHTGGISAGKRDVCRQQLHDYA